jgi:hypothetical protein
MRRTLLALTAVLSTLALAAGPAWWKGTFTVTNDSDYDVHHLFLTPANKVSWGRDWLKNDPLLPHEQVTLTGLDCDVKLIDDEGDVCIVEDIDLCQEDLHWEVTNATLAKCSGWAK